MNVNNRTIRNPQSAIRNLLVIGYHYPPMRGGERTAKFVKYLPEFGYAPVVLTTSAFGGRSSEQIVRAPEVVGWLREAMNRAQRDASEEVRSQIRTWGPGFRRVSAWVQRWLFVPDGQVGWLPWAFWWAWRMVKTRNVEVVYASYPPASALVLGWALKRTTGKPWVADFRDAWTFDRLDEGIGRIRMAVDRHLEWGMMTAADRVIVATDEARDNFVRRYPEMREKLRTIPNGFDSEDLEHIPSVAYDRGERMILVHTGAFAYSHPERRPFAFFRALEALLEAERTIAQRLRGGWVGALTDEERRAAMRLVSEGLVEVIGLVGRRQALAYQHVADALLLVDHPRRERASNVPGKCYEYLAMRKPILALVPDGAARDLMHALDAGMCVDPEDTGGIRQALGDLVRRFQMGCLKSSVPKDALRRFERRTLAGELAACFDEVVGARRVRIER